MASFRGDLSYREKEKLTMEEMGEGVVKLLGLHDLPLANSHMCSPVVSCPAGPQLTTGEQI